MDFTQAPEFQKNNMLILMILFTFGLIFEQITEN